MYVNGDVYNISIVHNAWEFYTTLAIDKIVYVAYNRNVKQKMSCLQ